ncbi:MAG: chromosomal replication initiator protein DnaA [Limnochordales bacterium]|jgi:chromosomal replication initiator protein DnaA|nr:chromosomal replication initiator protein DnaA [Bacillota bacterium]
MLEQLTPLWSETVQRLLQQTNDESLAAWMKDARPVAVDDGCLVVQVPNKFTRDWVSMRYGEAIRNTLQELSGAARDVRFVVPGASADPEPPAVREGVGAPALGAFGPKEAAWTQAPAGVSREPAPPPQNLNPRYTFDSFVVGPSNRFAHAACLAVAEAPAEAYNPLFIYGGVGLGKTHLMQAIAHHSYKADPTRRIVYVSSETFTNELINALQHKCMPAFRAKYRSVDILLIDDIQFIAGKESTQEEFFHTFNALFEVNKQIVISSDRPPRDIPHLEERLRSRFEWGLAADIQPPDFETRTAIIRKKAADEGLQVSNDVLIYIAQVAQSNIRELEGALTRVVAYARTVGKPLTVELAAEALRDFLAAQKPQPISIATIQQCVARYFGLRVSDLTSRTRSRNVAFPRQIAMYLARTMTDLSLPAIGEEFGGRDHTTVLHGYEKVREQLAVDRSLAATIEELKQMITNSG